MVNQVQFIVWRLGWLNCADYLPEHNGAISNVDDWTLIIIKRESWKNRKKVVDKIHFTRYIQRCRLGVQPGFPYPTLDRK